MIVYVETNFVLELALLQEQSASCTELLALAEAGRIHLAVPAFSLSEPYETLRRRRVAREALNASVEREMRELRRTRIYAGRMEPARETLALLIESAEDERQRLEEVRAQLLRNAHVIPLSAAVLSAATHSSERHGLSAPDAIVYASILHDLHGRTGADACFLNRNTRDFDDPDMIAELRALNCRLMPGFDGGLQHVRRSIGLDLTT